MDPQLIQLLEQSVEYAVAYLRHEQFKAQAWSVVARHANTFSEPSCAYVLNRIKAETE